MSGSARIKLHKSLSIDQIVDISNVIVRGTVTEVWTEPDPETKTIWTHAQVEVEHVLKGSPQTSIVVIEQPGGEVGGKKIRWVVEKSAGA